MVRKINFKPFGINPTDCYDLKNAYLSTLTTLGTNMKKLIVAIVTAAFTSLAMAQAAAPVAEPAAVAAPAPTVKKTKSHKAKAGHSKKSTKKHATKKPSAKKK